MNRRELLSRIPLLLMAIPVIGCAAEEDRTPRPPGGGGGGGDNEAAPDAGGAAAFEVRNQDSSGHSHSFELSCANLEGRQYAYTAGGAHTHTVTLTDAQIDDVLAGRTVMIETSGGHPHTWIIAMPASLCG